MSEVIPYNTTVRIQFKMNDIPLTIIEKMSIMYYRFLVNTFKIVDGEVEIMKCKLSTMMGKARYSIQDVHVKTGLSRSTVTQLYHDKATRIDFETIEKLCDLFDCEINDLFCLDGINIAKIGGKSNEV